VLSRRLYQSTGFSGLSHISGVTMVEYEAFIG